MIDIDDLLIGLARGLNLVGALSLFGTLVVAVFVAAPLRRHAKADLKPLPPQLQHELRQLLRIALAVNLAAAVAWLFLQARGAIEDKQSLAEGLRLVSLSSTFGHALLARSLILAVAVIVAGSLQSQSRLTIATAAAAAGLTLQSQLGHPAASDSLTLTVAASLHSLAAGAWLGGLVPLALAVARLPAPAAISAARRFSWIGMAAVAIIIVTACIQAGDLVGDLGGWFGTAYGFWTFGKIAGLGLLLLFALANRALFTPRLDRGRWRGWFVASIGAEAAVGLAVVAIAVTLATRTPGAHDTPIWPFPVQPDLSRVSEPYIRREFERAALLVLVALAGAACLFFRRTRLVGPAAAVVLLAFVLPRPNLRLLVKPAFPTSYQQSETGYTSASIVQGLALLKQHCTSACFRPLDDPSDLTPYGIWQRPDGDLYGWLTSVFDRIGHSPFPYGVISSLTSRERWQLIDYFRARVAGSALKRRGFWTYPVLAPALPILCGGEPRELSSLRGHIVQLVAVSGGTGLDLPKPPPGILVTTILLTNGSAPTTGPDTCVSTSPDAWSAYAIVAGLPEDRLDGSVFLIDANGWLRRRESLPPAEDPAARDTLVAHVRTIAADPFQAAGIGAHGH